MEVCGISGATCVSDMMLLLQKRMFICLFVCYYCKRECLHQRSNKCGASLMIPRSFQLLHSLGNKLGKVSAEAPYPLKLPKRYTQKFIWKAHILVPSCAPRDENTRQSSGFHWGRIHLVALWPLTRLWAHLTFWSKNFVSVRKQEISVMAKPHLGRSL